MTNAPEYVAARRVLLDALDAIGAHRASVVLVGAQAVYVDAGDTNWPVAVMTTDSDLVLQVDSLAPDPELASALGAAGFVPGSQPGSWLGQGQVAVDLMVVPHQSNRSKGGARAAWLPPHAKTVARITPGLEPALIDNTARELGALESKDERTHTIAVAGPAALIAAKMVKLEERLRDSLLGRANRVRGKDALDVFRLLRAVQTNELVEGFALHRTEPHAERVSAASLHFLADNGRTATNFLSTLAASEMPSDPTVAVSFAALTNDLLGALGL